MNGHLGSGPSRFWDVRSLESNGVRLSRMVSRSSAMFELAAIKTWRRRKSCTAISRSSSVHHVTAPHRFLRSQTRIRTPDPSHRGSFRVVLHRPEQLPNHLEYRMELPCDDICMHLGCRAPKRTQARAKCKSTLVFAPFATSADHAVCSDWTRIRSLLGVESVEGCE